MNFMGEVFSMLGLSAFAGVIIGWCIRNFFGGSEKSARQHFARDIDEAVQDANHLRATLDSKQEELHQARHELQQMRRSGSSSESETRVQVAEINSLKNQLAASKKTLHNNQSEFNTFRTEAQKEQTELRNELAKYTNAGAASPERLNEANETIAALRSAVRENDKVIDSLRARVKEADSSVENLRNQLKSSESVRSKTQNVTLEYDRKIEELTKKADDSATTIEKQKRDYDLMLENKNQDIKNLHTKIEDMTNSSSSLQTREHEFNKELKSLKETQTRHKSEIVDLKRVISDRDQALTKARQRTTELNEEIRSIKEHEERELEQMQAKVKDATEIRSKVKSKSAEISALNEMLTDSSNKRNSLQADVSNLKRTLEEKDTSITSLRSEIDDVVASRNKVSSQLGELQTQGNIALEKLQQDLNNLAKTRDEYKARIDSLQQEVTELKSSKQKLDQLTESSKVKEEKLKGESKVWQNEVKKLNTSSDEYKRQIESLQGQISELTRSKDSQLQELRTQLTASNDSSKSKITQITSDFSNRNTMLQNDLKTLQAKVKEQSLTIENHKSDLANQIEINKRASAKIAENEKKVADLRTRLHQEESQSQRLNHQLSEAESVRLTLTERDAELRKTQIELQDATTSGAPLQAQLDAQVQKCDTLIRAMQDRDEELARLNTQLTNNSLRSKQQQSSITLLTQEKDAQTELIKSLEKQAESTLQLHTKIAQQSTELEDLRARLFERENRTTGSSKAQVQSGLRQVETRQTSSSKPRVFVRSETDTETLTGATGYQSSARPQFTADGHRTQGPDGTDNLSLLPGITSTIAGALSRHGITAFEQVANWGDREVAHYAERVGVPVQRANQFNWPKAASSILNGTFRTDSQEIGN